MTSKNIMKEVFINWKLDRGWK